MSPHASTAHAMRASLLVSATETSRNGFLASSFPDPVGKAGRLVLRVAHHGRGADDQQAPEVAIALFGDATEAGLAAGGLLLWR